MALPFESGPRTTGTGVTRPVWDVRTFTVVGSRRSRSGQDGHFPGVPWVEKERVKPGRQMSSRYFVSGLVPLLFTRPWRVTTVGPSRVPVRTKTQNLRVRLKQSPRTDIRSQLQVEVLSFSTGMLVQSLSGGSSRTGRRKGLQDGSKIPR